MGKKVGICCCLKIGRNKFLTISIILFIIGLGILAYDGYLVSYLMRLRDGEELQDLKYTSNFANYVSFNGIHQGMYRYINDTQFPPICCDYIGVDTVKQDQIVMYPILALIFSTMSAFLSLLSIFKLGLANQLKKGAHDVKNINRSFKCVDVVIFLVEVSFTIVMIEYYFSEKNRLMADGSELKVLGDFGIDGCNMTCVFKDDICYTEFKCVNSKIKYYENVRMTPPDDIEECTIYPSEEDGEDIIDFWCHADLREDLQERGGDYDYYERMKDNRFKCKVYDDYNAECYNELVLDIRLYGEYVEAINDIYGITIIVDSIGDVIDLIAMILILGFFI